MAIMADNPADKNNESKRITRMKIIIANCWTIRTEIMGVYFISVLVVSQSLAVYPSSWSRFNQFDQACPA